MPQKKKTTKRKTVTRSAALKKAPARKSSSSAKPQVARKEKYSEEYTEYLERYELFGEGRPHLSQAEFDRFDEELLDLLALELERGLNDDQTIRLKELEFLLLDSEQ